jgi:hypothetical protein
MNLSKSNIASGADKATELDILNTWVDYYSKVFNTVLDTDPKNMEAFKKNLEESQSALATYANMLRSQLKD